MTPTEIESQFIALIEKAEAGRTENLIPFGNAMGSIAWCVGYLSDLDDTDCAHATNHWDHGFVRAADGKPERSDTSPATVVHAVGWVGGEVDHSKCTAPRTLLRETVRRWVTIGVGQTKPEHGHSGGIITVWPEAFGGDKPSNAWEEWAKVEAPDRFKVAYEDVREWLGPELCAVIDENLPAYRYCSRVRPPDDYQDPKEAWRKVNDAIVRWGELGHGFAGVTSASIPGAKGIDLVHEDAQDEDEAEHHEHAGHDLPRNPFSSLVAVMEAARKLQKPAVPLTEFWRAVFMDQEDRKLQFKSSDDADWVPPNDVSSRPSGFVVTKPRPKVPNRPLGIENRRYIGSFRVTEANKTENQRRWREILFTHGVGTYRWYDTLDEAGEKPIPPLGTWQKVLFIHEDDIETMRLGLGETPLSDEEVAELEASYMDDVRKGDARKAQTLAFEHDRRGNRKDAKRVAEDGMKADDYDAGIWKNYDEEKRAQRDIQRRLLDMHNRHAGLGGALYSTVDCGEADPKRMCEKCGKPGALGADATFAALWLCHACRRLPRSEWPKPKPLQITPFFTGYGKFAEATESGSDQS